MQLGGMETSLIFGFLCTHAEIDNICLERGDGDVVEAVQVNNEAAQGRRAW